MIFASAVIVNEAGQVLLVQESTPPVHGKYNLPGGHVEQGESPIAAAVREAEEEVGLAVTPTSLIGIYCFHAGRNFVFRADSDGAPPVANPAEILACAWLSPEQIASLPDDAILNPLKLHSILKDLSGGKAYPLECIRGPKDGY